MNGTIDPTLFYFIVFQVDTDPNNGPSPDVSGEKRARDWSCYILYTGDPRLTGGGETFLYKAINPDNPDDKFAPPTPLINQPFSIFPYTKKISRSIQGQVRNNNALVILLERDEFLGSSTSQNPTPCRMNSTQTFTRFDITFLVATAGVDEITNPPSPPEPGQVWDAIDTLYIQINNTNPGQIFNADLNTSAESQTVEDAPTSAADIRWWEVRFK